MKRRRAVALSLVVVGAAGLAAGLAALGDLAGVGPFESYTLDLRQETTAESFLPGVGERESAITLVLFDEFSVLDSIGGWPWLSPFPRQELAELVDVLSAAGARTIGLDVYLDRLFPRLGGDDALRAAIERAGNVVLASPVVRTDSGPVAAPPHPRFAGVAAGVGAAELPAAFETFRDGALAVRSGHGLAPSFALAIYAHARGLDVDSLLGDAWRTGRVALPGLPEGVGEVPDDWREGSGETDRSVIPFRVRYVGPPSSADAADPPGTFPALASGTLEISALLRPELFRDRIVLIGSGFHAEDRFRTPFFGYQPSSEASDETGAPAGVQATYGWMYGVEVHANALQNMLDAEYVRPLGALPTTGLLLLVAVVTGGAAFRGGAAWGGGALAVTVLAIVAFAFWAWAGVVYLPGVEVATLGDRFVWVPIGVLVLGAAFSYVGSVAYVSIVEGKDKRRIKNAFGMYLHPDVVEEIAEDPSALRLGGERRPLSILVSDLSGFTTISESMEAEDLVSLLNEYLDDMTEVVLEQGGYVDKYIGDAIMAFWNAPNHVEDHADRALRTAISMQRRMADLNARWMPRRPGREPLKVRIGVHTGDVVVGNVGGKERFNYSAIGDDVNLAARLEPANKTYGTLNMVSAATLAAARGGYRVRELDRIAVVGKEEPVHVFELLEEEGVRLDPELEAALGRYAEGLGAYKAHDWRGARAHFAAAVEACPVDGPSRLYVARCDANIADPPPPDWDFVVRRTEK